MDDDREMGSREHHPKRHMNLMAWSKRAPLTAICGKDDAKTVAGLGEEGEEGRSEKPNVVRMPKADIVVSPPLEAEANVRGKISRPVILWPLYAFGGYLILSWAWGRWKERRAQKKPHDGDDNVNIAQSD